MRGISRGQRCALLTLLLLAAVVSTAEAAEEVEATSVQSRELTVAQLDGPSDIEAEILALSHGGDPNMVNQILAALARLESPDDRAHLQRLLDAQLTELNRVPHLFSEEDLQVQIETLQLGSQATVNNLRARDQMVSVIAQISDPIRREQLLRRLEERECEAETRAEQL